MGWFQPPSKKVSVDVRLDEVVLRTLEAEPQRRYQQASEIRTAIENLQDGSVAPAPASLSNLATSDSGGGIRLHKLLDESETKYRTRHTISTLAAPTIFPVLGFISGLMMPDYAVYFGIACLLLAVATLYYSVQVKKKLVFQTTYKGHDIVLDCSGTWAEKIYLDGGLVQTGGLGINMEFRMKIKAGDGIGDEIVILFTAGVWTVRCRIEAQEYL